MTRDEIKAMYETDKDVKEYIDKYCYKHSLTVEEAIAHKLIKEYADYSKEYNEIKLENMWR